MKNRILVVVILFCFFSCEYIFQLKSDEDLKKEIELELSKSDGIIDFSKFTDFEWDDLLILGPYSSVEKTEKQLGLDLYNIHANSIKDLDVMNVIVFIKDKKSIKIVELVRNFGDFDKESRLCLIKKSKSRFMKNHNIISIIK